MQLAQNNLKNIFNNKQGRIVLLTKRKADLNTWYCSVNPLAVEFSFKFEHILYINVNNTGTKKVNIMK